jgi:hypothetical protein
MWLTLVCELRKDLLEIGHHKQFLGVRLKTAGADTQKLLTAKDAKGSQSTQSRNNHHGDPRLMMEIRAS